MKESERLEALQLRRKGIAIGAIALQLGVAKSSVSSWVRDVELPKALQLKLKQNSHSRSSIEKRRVARLANTEARRVVVRDSALSEVSYLQDNPLWYVGVSLYWGEGGKTQQVVRISNSDPAVIQTMMNFFRTVCMVDEKDFRGQLHIFAHSDKKASEQYWSDVSGVPIKQFYKSYIKNSSASKSIRNKLPYGTFQVYVNDSILFIRILTWIEYLKKNTI